MSEGKECGFSSRNKNGACHWSVLFLMTFEVILFQFFMLNLNLQQIYADIYYFTYNVFHFKAFLNALKNINGEFCSDIITFFQQIFLHTVTIFFSFQMFIIHRRYKSNSRHILQHMWKNCVAWATSWHYTICKRLLSCQIWP